MSMASWLWVPCKWYATTTTKGWVSQSVLLWVPLQIVCSKNLFHRSAIWWIVVSALKICILHPTVMHLICSHKLSCGRLLNSRSQPLVVITFWIKTISGIYHYGLIVNASNEFKLTDSPKKAVKKSVAGTITLNPSVRALYFKKKACQVLSPRLTAAQPASNISMNIFN